MPNEDAMEQEFKRKLYQRKSIDTVLAAAYPHLELSFVCY